MAEKGRIGEESWRVVGKSGVLDGFFAGLKGEGILREVSSYIVCAASRARCFSFVSAPVLGFDLVSEGPATP